MSKKDRLIKELDEICKEIVEIVEKNYSLGQNMHYPKCSMRNYELISTGIQLSSRMKNRKLLI